MNIQTLNLESGVIVYDADLLSQAALAPSAELFQPSWWEEAGRVMARPQGRGDALVVAAPFGGAVLKQYLRGGWPARISRSRYVFTGFDRSRPIKEFRVLQELADLALPAPRPVAALCRRHGLSCSGALLTREIEHARPLAEIAESVAPELWQAIGACVRRFHDHGLVHADLNARNILVTESAGVFLIDFDRARFKGTGKAFSGNLKRLKRSLLKFWPEDAGDMERRAWTQLLKGYECSNRRA